MELFEVGCQRVPVPTWVAELGPGIDRSLGVGHESLTVDGTRAAKKLSLGERYDLPIESFLIVWSVIYQMHGAISLLGYGKN